MASFLEGVLRKELAKGFKGQLLKGVLFRDEYGELDDRGNPTTTRTQYSVEGFIDEYNDIYRAQAGIPENDVKVVLIAGNCEVDPIKDDLVSFPNWPTYKIRAAKTDPALAHYTCQSFKVQ